MIQLLLVRYYRCAVGTGGRVVSTSNKCRGILCMIFESSENIFWSRICEMVTLHWGEETLPINSNAGLVILNLPNLNHENLFLMNNSET